MMRHFLLLSTLISSLVVMNANAESLGTPATTESNPAKPITVVKAALNSQLTPAQSQTNSAVRATLHLKQQEQRLYAYVLVEQKQTNSGKIRIDWTPPLHSSCDKSSYILSYQGKKFHTQAYRTLGYSLINGKSITCTGTWQATVTNEQGTQLTTATIIIDSVDAYANNAKMRSLAAIA